MTHLAQSGQSGMPELACVANELKLSPACCTGNWQRKAISFAICAKPRCSKLRWHVQEGRCPFRDIALLLGYSEQSAFTRAFKRWTGLSPRNGARANKIRFGRVAVA